jgi:hypothetical protein
VIDVMSDSAAPRDAEPSSRNAPGALAVNRFLAGWLDDDDVVDLSAGGEHSIVGGDGDVSGPRLATVDLTMDMFLTVEVVTPGVDNVHISSAGVAVHVIDFSDGVCELPPCVGTARRQGLLVDTRRSDGLLETGSVVEFGGVRVQVGAMRTVDGVTRAEVTVRRVA